MAGTSPAMTTRKTWMAGTRLRQGFAGLSSVSPPKLQRRRASPANDEKENHFQVVRKSPKMLDAFSVRLSGICRALCGFDDSQSGRRYAGFQKSVTIVGD